MDIDKLTEFLHKQCDVSLEYMQDCIDRGERISLQSYHAAGEINAYEKVLNFLQEN